MYRDAHRFADALSNFDNHRTNRFAAFCTDLNITTPKILLEHVVGIEPTWCGFAIHCLANQPHMHKGNQVPLYLLQPLGFVQQTFGRRVVDRCIDFAERGRNQLGDKIDDVTNDATDRTERPYHDPTNDDVGIA